MVFVCILHATWHRCAIDDRLVRSRKRPLNRWACANLDHLPAFSVTLLVESGFAGPVGWRKDGADRSNMGLWTLRTQVLPRDNGFMPIFIRASEKLERCATWLSLWPRGLSGGRP